MRLSAGLGYYSRAKNLLNTSKIVQSQHNGILPADFGLGLHMGTVTKAEMAITYGDQVIEERKPTMITKRSRRWTQDDVKFWNKFGIDLELLTKFVVNL